jgi:hypothetical protein
MFVLAIVPLARMLLRADVDVGVKIVSHDLKSICPAGGSVTSERENLSPALVSRRHHLEVRSEATIANLIFHFPYHDRSHGRLLVRQLWRRDSAYRRRTVYVPPGKMQWEDMLTCASDMLFNGEGEAFNVRCSQRRNRR